MNSEASGPQKALGAQDNTTLWIIVGVVAACLCLGLVVVLGIAGVAYFSLQQVVATVTAAPGFSPETDFDQPPAGMPTDQTLVGETIFVPEQSKSHVQPGESHPPYNSDPPTSGWHYSQAASAGWCEEPIEDEYLVHSLEHGYVIIWYDCSQLSERECDNLKSDIQDVMDEFDRYKLIGIPREGMQTAIALTSWTRLARLEAFDGDSIRDFIVTNLNHAPEPNAP